MALFSWLMAQFYDRIIKDAETKCLGKWRKELLSNLSGEVLEIGCGTGINLDYYPNTVTHLTLLEPDPNMRKKLQEKIAFQTQTKFVIEILDSKAESIPSLDNSFDAVISTLVLCSVKNQNKVLSEVYRVLNSNGEFIFIEHILANNNPKRLKWQQRLEPIWKVISCGCHITRPTENMMIKAGFSFSEISHQSIRGVPPIVRPNIKGIAIKSPKIK